MSLNLFSQGETKTESSKNKFKGQELSFSQYKSNFSLCRDHSRKFFNPELKNFSALFKLVNPKYEFSLAPDLAKITNYRNKKNYWLPILETGGINFIIWAHDKYYLKAGWADISFKTIIRNIKRGYTWDDNSFQCNHFEHPFHGALHFTAARANGLNFWQSMIFPFFGSVMWEIVLENNRASTNDSIMNILGGITLGEVLFKIANVIIDETSTGPERLLREISAFVINPGLAFDRLVKGRIWRKRGNTSKHYYALNVPVGFSSRHFTRRATPAIEADLVYLDAFRKREIEPYNYFTLQARLDMRGNEKNFYNLELITKGMLFGRKVDFPLSTRTLAGVFAGFDYINTDAIGKISSVDIGYGLISSFELGAGFFIDYYEIVSVVIFGGSSSLVSEKYGNIVYTKHGEQFNFKTSSNPYYMGPGLTGELGLEFGKRSIGSIFFRAKGYWIKGILAKHASENLNKFSIGVNLSLTNKTQIRFETDFYMRNGMYRDIDLYKRSKTTRLMYVFWF